MPMPSRRICCFPEDLIVEAVEIGIVVPATEESARTLIAIDDDDLRSEWVWVRLADGSLMLGCYPRGEALDAAEAEYHASLDANPARS